MRGQRNCRENYQNFESARKEQRNNTVISSLTEPHRSGLPPHTVHQHVLVPLTSLYALVDVGELPGSHHGVGEVVQKDSTLGVAVREHQLMVGKSLTSEPSTQVGRVLNVTLPMRKSTWRGTGVPPNC